MLEQRKMAEQLRVDLLLLESKLLDLIPLNQLNRKNAVPKYIEEEKRKIDETRDNLIQLILQERKKFDEFQWGIQDIHEEITRRSSRKHWRAYAEYGKARCYFLKTMPLSIWSLPTRSWNTPRRYSGSRLKSPGCCAWADSLSWACRIWPACTTDCYSCSVCSQPRNSA